MGTYGLAGSSNKSKGRGKGKGKGKRKRKGKGGRRGGRRGKGTTIDLASDSDDDSDDGPSAAERTMAEMYRPPLHLMLEYPLRIAQQKAALEGRWLLVVLIPPMDFGSMRFIRDVLKNDSVTSVIGQAMRLWMQPTNSGEGRQAAGRYASGAASMGAMGGVGGGASLGAAAGLQVQWQGLLDPRTGECKSVREGAMTAEQETEWLTEFVASQEPLPGQLAGGAGSASAAAAGGNSSSAGAGAGAPGAGGGASSSSGGSSATSSSSASAVDPR